MIKKLIVIFSLISILCSFIFAETDLYMDLLSQVEKYNFDMLIHNNSQKIDYNNIIAKKCKWLPKLLISVDESLSNDNINNNQLITDTNLNLYINQSLPLGSNISFFGNQRFTVLNNTQNKFKYDPAFGCKLNIPILFFSPSIVNDLWKIDNYNYKNDLNMLQLGRKIMEKSLISQAVNIIGEYVLLSKLIDLDDRLSKVLKISSVSDNTLWRNGSISIFELNKRNNDRNIELQQMIQRKEYMNIATYNVESLGLCPGPPPINNLEEWIKEWDKYLQNYTKVSSMSFLSEKFMINTNWNSQVNSLSKELPIFFVESNFYPVSSKQSYDSMIDSIRDSFSKNAKLSWQVKAGFNISLDPFNSRYSLNKKVKNLKQIHNLQLRKADDNSKKKSMEIQNTYNMLKAKIEQSKAILHENTIRLKTAKALLNANRISSVDYDMQEITMQKYEIQYWRDRISLIAFKLKFYTKDNLKNMN